jgi:GH25 family lysozyme M1 (1,4-beta-N-acetylmuramidase)
MWQFTSAGKLAGFDYHLDLDVAYMTREQWMRYANPDAKVSDTAELPKVSSQGKTFHFSNSLFDIDITMKGGKTNGA